MKPENTPSEFVTDCTSTEDFIRSYYKRLDRDLATWGEDFLKTKVASYDAEIAAHGHATISAHDSVTGRMVKLRPAPAKDEAHRSQLSRGFLGHRQGSRGR